MKIFNNISDFTSEQSTIVTIGTFDGVHIGHQKIIEQLITLAQQKNKKSVVLTFFPHPRMVLHKDDSIKLINTIEERINLLEKTGLDYLIIHTFNKQFAEMSSLEFVKDILVGRLKIDTLFIGHDHHFGKNREGNIIQLTKYSKTYNFTVIEIDAQDIDKIAVSSTKIRNALKTGNLKTANKYLGYQFAIKGTVVNGNKLGRKIGYPTANISIIKPYKLIPKTGVYIVQCNINNLVVFGMMNIGNRPTVNGKNQTIEVHFFDFNTNLYQQELEIKLLYFLRGEKKFNSLQELILQLQKDEIIAKTYLSNKFNV